MSDQPDLFTPRPQAVHANSARAYREETGPISKRAQAVLANVLAHGPGTDREIASRMGYAHRSAVQPRISELISAGKLREVGKTRCRETGKQVRVAATQANGAME